MMDMEAINAAHQAATPGEWENNRPGNLELVTQSENIRHRIAMRMAA